MGTVDISEGACVRACVCVCWRRGGGGGGGAGLSERQLKVLYHCHVNSPTPGGAWCL
eukprot:COSAG03_NODE_9918_length_685_cov_31.979522_2_plen_56_part_01